jgi:alkylhydroperoxidase family enzyme
VEFLCIYVREAHPTDGWRASSNDKAGITFKQPINIEDRTDVADQCCKALKMSMPLLVDTMDDTVGHAYSGMPDRIYLLDTQGRVAYKGGRGPFEFRPREMEQSLVLMLMEEEAKRKKQPKKQTPHAGAAGSKKVSARVPLLDQKAAWQQLPTALKGAGEPLPVWARALAKSLPQTTAAMLELDYLHRVDSPLPALLRGKMRWIAADANGCAYTRLQAEDDLLRDGLPPGQLAKLKKGDVAGLSNEEKATLVFAGKLTRAAHTVTDAEVADLIKHHGDKQVVAMVLLLAHANFQDRLLLTLGITPKLEQPLPPLAVRFDFTDEGISHLKPVARKLPDEKLTASGLQGQELKKWTAQTLGELKAQMNVQKGLKGRIAVPTWEELVKQFPVLAERKKPVDIKWSRVCLGYQPKLARGWSACTSFFGAEAKQDRVFEESQFWVVTRSLQCYY